MFQKIKASRLFTRTVYLDTEPNAELGESAERRVRVRSGGKGTARALLAKQPVGHRHGIRDALPLRQTEQGIGSRLNIERIGGAVPGVLLPVFGQIPLPPLHAGGPLGAVGLGLAP